MRRVEFMIGPHDFTTLKAEQFMQNVVSYYHMEDTGDKLAGAITEGGFGSVPILSEDGMVLGIVSEFDLIGQDPMSVYEIETDQGRMRIPADWLTRLMRPT